MTAVKVSYDCYYWYTTKMCINNLVLVTLHFMNTPLDLSLFQFKGQ